MSSQYDQSQSIGLVVLSPLGSARVVGGASFPRLLLLDPSPAMLAFAKLLIDAAIAGIDQVTNR
jgi:hypothetical protein